MWFDESIFYHIYPVGFCGAEKNNDFVSCSINRLAKINDWIPHLKKLGVNAIYLGPVFEASAHGYDIKDYFHVDRRLGTDEDLKNLIVNLHNNGIKVVVDAVFNHVGRDFWAFRDVRDNLQNSQYVNWFKIDFSKNNHYNDGFVYKGWDGCDNLVKLNLANKDIKNHILHAVETWIADFGIDGLRLDVAHYLTQRFLKDLRKRCDVLKPDFWLMGEVLFRDYRKFLKPEMLNSITNYECYKGMHSSLNSQNMFEIAYSLNRLFGEKEGICKAHNLYNFLDNHDVSRIASVLENKNLLKPLYTLLFTIPGIPSIYYGSEWVAEGKRQDGDENVRQCFEHPLRNDFTKHLIYLAELRKKSKALAYGSYQEVFVSNEVLIFAREYQGKKIVVGVNVGGNPFEMNFEEQKIELNAFSSEIWEI